MYFAGATGPLRSSSWTLPTYDAAGCQNGWNYTTTFQIAGTLAGGGDLDGDTYGDFVLATPTLSDPGSSYCPAFPGQVRLVSQGSFNATSINVPGRHHSQGFPGVSDRTLWFGVDYNGSFTVARAGQYRFRLTSDDGSRLEIDGKPVIDNDGIHAPSPVEGRVWLARGTHRIHVPYFQGPADLMALILEVAPDDAPWRVFRTDRPLD